MATSAPALNVLWSDGRLVGKVVVPGPTYFGYDEEWLAGGYNLSPLVVPFTPVVLRQQVPSSKVLPRGSPRGQTFQVLPRGQTVLD